MGQIASFSTGAIAPKIVNHPAERLALWLQRAGLGFSTRSPEGRSELTLTAPEGFDPGPALRALEAAMAPPEPAQLARWLAALLVITAGRPRDDLDTELVMAIYAERLAAFPSDVVEHVVLRERWKWFPPIAELEDRCEQHTLRRRLALDLLAQGRVRIGTPPPPPPRVPVSQEARRRILTEVFGDGEGPTAPVGGWLAAGQAVAQGVTDGAA